jgi:hypothetical protein
MIIMMITVTRGPCHHQRGSQDRAACLGLRAGRKPREDLAGGRGRWRRRRSVSEGRRGTGTTVTAMTAGAAVAVALGGGLAACSTGSVSRVLAPKPSAPAPATSAPKAAPKTTPRSNPNSGPLGTTYQVGGTDSNSNSTAYKVTAVVVDQHSSLAPYDSLTNSADHLAAVKFRITGVTGESSDDANNNASVISGDTTQYPSALNSTADGPNFSSGSFTVAPGQTASGWVTFELPPGQSVASVQWVPSSGLSDQAGTWTVAGTPPTAAPAAPVPAPPQKPAPSQQAPPGSKAPTQNVNAEAVVTQFYQDITNHDYQAAWALGGDNLNGGVGYDKWVAGYATTASISPGTFSSSGSDQVTVSLSADQTDGSTTTYQGTYTVQNGVIVSANITQTS